MPNPHEIQKISGKKKQEDDIVLTEQQETKKAANDEKGAAFSIVMTDGKKGKPQVDVKFPEDSLYTMDGVEQSGGNSKMTVSLKSDPNSKITFGKADGKFEFDVSLHTSSSPKNPHQMTNPDGTSISFRIENGNVVDLQSKGFKDRIEFTTKDGKMEFNPETGKLQKMEQQKAAAPDVAKDVLKDAARIGKGLADSGVSASADTAKQSLPAQAAEQTRGR